MHSLNFLQARGGKGIATRRTSAATSGGSPSWRHSDWDDLKRYENEKKKRAAYLILARKIPHRERIGTIRAAPLFKGKIVPPSESPSEFGERLLPYCTSSHHGRRLLPTPRSPAGPRQRGDRPDHCPSECGHPAPGMSPRARNPGGAPADFLSRLSSRSWTTRSAATPTRNA